jgi:ribose transport system substrate-binding protein
MLQTKRLRVLIISIMVITVIAFGISVNHAESKTLKVGYAVSILAHEWYQVVSRSAAMRAKELNVQLMLADANLDAMKQFKACENFINQQVDFLVISPVDPNVLVPIVKKANSAGIPVISEANVVKGAVTYIGIDNKKAGIKVGKWFGEYAKANNINPNILIIGQPWLPDCVWRVDGFKEGLQEVGCKYKIVNEVDGYGLKEKSFTVASPILEAHPEINVIFGINDNSALGAMAAYEAIGLDPSKLTVIGVGLEGIAGRSALAEGTPYKVSVAIFPSFVGGSMIDVALALENGKKIPKVYEAPAIIITKDNFYKFYKKVGNNYITNLDAVRSFMQKQ